VVETDKGTYNGLCLLATIANANQWGNNAFIAPKASISDGNLQVVIIEPFPLLIAPIVLWQLANKKLDASPHIKVITCTKGTISTQIPMPTHIDGEWAGNQQAIAFEVVPSAVRLVG
jgi:diacylglycerol kinase family enzyme